MIELAFEIVASIVSFVNHFIKNKKVAITLAVFSCITLAICSFYKMSYVSFCRNSSAGLISFIRLIKELHQAK